MKFFTPYQQKWAEDDSRKKLAEKSVRVGWTFAESGRSVFQRLEHHNRDHLFVSKDQDAAIEFVRTASLYVDLVDASRFIISRGEDWQKVGTGSVARDVRVAWILFDTGSRIRAFSSNPVAVRSYGGDVTFDEFAFHPDPEALWAAGSGRAMWGYQFSVFSSHNGDGTLFNEVCEDARNGLGGWSYYKVDIHDALDQGLLDRINRKSGLNMTREEFLEDCRSRARTEEVWAQEYLCQPIGGRNPLVDPAIVDECCDMEPILRDHLDAQDVANRFGDPSAPGYEKRVEAYLSQIFGKLRDTPARYRMGFDVAASGGGDLTVLWLDELQVDESRQEKLKCRACLSIRSENWTFIETCVAWFMANLSDIQATGDETGLGRQICWSMATRFPGRFAGLNFGTKKSELMTRLMDQLTAGEKRLPGREKDIVTDVKALRKEWKGAKWVFTEGRNPLNNASHCDYAIASALASDAATRTSGFFSIAI